MEPEFALKTLCPIIHLRAFSPYPQTPIPCLHLHRGENTGRLPSLSTTAETKGACSSSQKAIGFPTKSWKHLQFCPSFRKPNQGSLDDTGVSTDDSRVMVNVASKDKEEACLRQKSHPPKKVLRPPPSFSTALYDSEQAIYN